MRVGYIAEGNLGTRHHLTDAKKHPRGQLMDACCRKHAAKMYCDTMSGETKHVGYVVAGEWFGIYEVHSWEGRSA